MDALKKNNKWGWVVLVLIVVNIVSLSALWIGYTKEPGKGEEERQGGMFLEERLQLTPAQTRELRSIREKHFENMRVLRRALQDSRGQLHAQPRTGSNPNQIDDLAAKIGNAHAAMEKELYRHFTEIRDMCTDEQKEIFDKIIVDVLQRSDRRSGPKGPPPGRPSSGRGGQVPPPNGH